jgi:GPH family glycoside/pentoside/hexuronide:cation symporter
MDTAENVIVENIEPKKENTKKLTLKDQFGYTLGDLGCVLVFGLAGSLLQKFYTDILHLPITQITILFLVARIWDGINDPLWGKIVDMVPPGKHGRYRPWIRTMAIPMGLITLLMFMRYPGMSLGGKLAYAYVTYIMWDMIYTTINIPYGSLASVITTDAKARSTLSILRSIGSGIGGVGAIILSGLCFTDVLNEEGVLVPLMDWKKLIIGVAILCFLCIICLFGCFYLTKERVPAPKIKSEKRPKGEFTKVIIDLIKSRPFVSLCLASMFLISGQMFVQSYGLYLMADYFLQPEMNIVVTITRLV